MLGKLLKYDLKWIYKLIIVFYTLALVFSVIGRCLSLIENSLIFSIITKITFGIAISMMASSFINCFMRLWVRFIRNIYKDESYLTHTLPVSKKNIYLSKILSALISVFTTIVVILVCLFICYYSADNMQILKLVLELAAGTYNTTVLNLILLISILIFLQFMFIVLLGYVGIILGHKANRNKMAITIITGFVLYMITQIVTLGIVLLFGAVNPDIMNLINTTTTVDIPAIKSVMYLAMGIYFIYIMIYYIIGKKQFEKGVNVD